MKKHSLGTVLLLAAVFLFTGCGTAEKTPARKGKRPQARMAQTGSYIPRLLPQKAAPDRARKAKTKRPKSATKPKKESTRVAEDFVPREGFR